MSVAFTKESDAEAVAANLPDRPIPPHANLVTQTGLLQIETALTQRELRTEAEHMRPVAEADRLRTALLAAVGHDLRRPLAAATAAVTGLRSTDHGLVNLFDLYGAGPVQRLTVLQLPNALPYFLTGLRIASGLALIGAIVADFFFNQGEKGIGYYIRNRQQRAANRPEMFAGTISASMFGVVMFLIVGAITARAIRNWHESASRT